MITSKAILKKVRSGEIGHVDIGVGVVEVAPGEFKKFHISEFIINGDKKYSFFDSDGIGKRPVKERSDFDIRFLWRELN